MKNNQTTKKISRINLVKASFLTSSVLPIVIYK